MILVDANLLIAAFATASPRHAFLRIVTNPRVMQRPASMAVARAQVSSWLESSAVWIPAPGDRHAAILDSLLAAPGVQGNLVTDAHIAALAIGPGLQVHCTDSDFARFPKLDRVKPLDRST